MSTRKIVLNGISVYADHVESVEDGISEWWDVAYDRYLDKLSIISMARTYSDVYGFEGYGDVPFPVEPSIDDYKVVVVRLSSGRRIEIKDKTKEEVEAIVDAEPAPTVFQVNDNVQSLKHGAFGTVVETPLSGRIVVTWDDDPPYALYHVNPATLKLVSRPKEGNHE